MAVRLKDIAHELNVSVITVSKALRGNTDISDATRQRVLQKMKELDYQPNMTARSLATGHSYIVGLIVPDLLNPFYAELAKSLGVELRTRSYGLIVASSEDKPETEQSEIRMMLARGVDALLISSCQTSADGLDVVRKQPIPFVLVDKPFPELKTNFVGSDDRAGGRLATEHLIGLGRTRLAYIGCPDLSLARERLRGFRTALEDREIELNEGWIVAQAEIRDSTDRAGYRMMQTLLEGEDRPNGVFCHNDVFAIGAMKATLDAGLSIPDDVAFVGFDNVRYSQYLQIPLTSVDQLTAQLGQAAAQLALSLVEKKQETPKPKRILLKPTLVVRQSSVGEAGLVALKAAASTPKNAAARKPRSR